ncbi:ATP-binding protein [Methanobrevibacter filiformis]|uniref:Putative AAA-ATPase n=1 Tax=Methanobrevibacter filiformis TaxID=55758 RepID=A0A165Z6V3_9EURY|nr:ATP-binding protein [Methanobrevibacter filiformis]KZX10321.1 putative AAA-ATPase [Methanobrevibacter filiformis]
MKEGENGKYFRSLKHKHFKKICLGTQTFKFLRENDFLYVDKTKEIYNLLNNEKIVFLSRPRRFGKSLLVSTLKSLFLGNKEFFKGLYIYDKWDWDEQYSVIHLDMSDLENSSTEELKLDLENTIETVAKSYNIILDDKISVRKKFSNLIMELYNSTGEKVVVLIDEYDAPILDNINNEELADANREVIESFYRALKNKDEYLRFVFITGISKFTHTSIFSKLNNPTDISLSNKYSTICGITHEELTDYCSHYIQFLADGENMDYNAALNEINHWYDGYSFDGEHNVFNPYSTLSALKSGEFSHYWFGTGTPHFLVDILKNREETIDFDDMIINKKDLNEIDPDDIGDLPLLFQGGYLTIDNKFKNEQNETEYSLKIPNFEVKQAYKDNLINFYLSEVEEDILDFQDELWEDIKNGDCESLTNYLEIQLGEIPYYLNITTRNDRWKVKQTIFLLLLKNMGFKIRSEVPINQGRIDAIFRDKKQIVITEVKYTQDQKKSIDTLVDSALNQIHTKQYYRLYKNKKYNVILLAIAFKDTKINKKDTVTEVKCKIEKLNHE